MRDSEHKYFFVHCQKCAGETIEQALSGKANKGYRGDPYRGSPEKHFSVNDYIEKYGEDEWKDYFTFSFVRNPWDRVISWISYRDKRWKLYGGKITPQIIKKEVNRQLFYENTYHKLLSLESERKPDYIGRFESLQEDFDLVCDKIGITRQPLPHNNKTIHKHYTEYYNSDTRNLVEKIYIKDIEYFNYEFQD